MPQVDRSPEVAKLVQAEIPLRQAIAIITGNTTPNKSTVSKYRQRVKKWEIEHPAAQKSACTALRNYAEGKDVNGIQPDAKTVLGAAIRIRDAVKPVVKEVRQTTVEHRYIEVHLEDHRDQPAQIPQDIVNGELCLTSDEEITDSPTSGEP